MNPDRRATFLYVLTGLFLVRVVGQPLSAVVQLPFLPDYEAWQGSTLPYPVLLGAQVLIVGCMVGGARGMRTGMGHPRRRAGWWVVAASAVYGSVMAVRLVLGLTLFRDIPWFARPVPAVFHLVLASYLAVYGFGLVHNDHA